MKFNRLDISELKRKNPRKAAAVKAAVLSVFPINEPKKNEPKSFYSVFLKMGSFALSALVLVFLVQGLVYLNSANKVKGEILGEATSAYQDLQNAGKNIGSQDFGSAESLFSSAQENIQKAQDKLDNFKVLEWLTPQANSAQHVLAGASLLAQAGQKLTGALGLLDELKVNNTGLVTTNINDRILENRNALGDARDLVSQSSAEFKKVNSVPLDYEQTLNSAQDQIAELLTILNSLINIEDLYLDLFTGQKTYLLVFQNYDELRATGGFIGTYGVLNSNGGSISNLKIESIYNLDGQILDQIAAPGPFQPDIKKWGIRDANWFVDFPTTAKKLLHFFESGQATADGVLALTPKPFSDILKLTGPINMPAYNVTLDSNNFQDLVQFETSENYDKVLNQPKKFLADFAPVLLDRMSKFTKEQWLQFFQIISDNLTTRQAMFYSSNPKAQQQIETLGFSGKILDADFDYLNINNSNLGGTKTDLEISQSVNFAGRILSDGSVIDTVNVTRTNQGKDQNRDYMRVLAPLGSTFISATGFDDYDYHASSADNFSVDPDLSAWDAGQTKSNVLVHTEAGKTEFSGWVNTAPDQNKTISLTYILPSKLKSNSLNSDSYSLLLQKQPGALPFAFNANVNIGEHTVLWQSPNISSQGSQFTWNSNSQKDDFWALVLSK